MADNLTPKEEFLLNPVTEHNITDAAVASFETNLKHPVKVTVPITPVQEGTGDPSPDNVRPISGLTGCVVKQRGKNLLDSSDYSGGRALRYSDGTFTETGTDGGPFGHIYYCCTFKNGTRIGSYSLDDDGAGRKARNITVNVGDIDTIQIGFLTINDNAYVNFRASDVIVESGTYNISYNVVTVPTSDIPGAFNDVQISKSDASYESYHGTTIPINWQTEAGTIYGGTVTLNEDGSADVVADKAWYDMGDLNYGLYGSLFNHYFADIPTFTEQQFDGWIYCSCYKPMFAATLGTINASIKNNQIMGRKTTKELYIKDTRFTSVADFKAGVAGQTIVVPLENPITYHFPNVGQLKAFLGQNNVWSDAGNVDVKYLTQNSATGLEYRGDRALELRRRAMIGDAPTIHTTVGSEETGGLASFKSYIKAPVKKIEIPFGPKQDLHGQEYPYPAGGGANKWDEVWELGVINNQTGENETSSTFIRTKNYIPVIPGETYYCYPSNKGFYFRKYGSNKEYLGYDQIVNSRREFTVPNDVYYLRIVWQQTTYNNDIALNYPSTVTTYSPYSNICPIEGLDGCKIVDIGYNLINLGVAEATPGALIDGKRILEPYKYYPGFHGSSINYYARNYITDFNVDGQGCSFIISAGNYSVGITFLIKGGTRAKAILTGTNATIGFCDFFDKNWNNIGGSWGLPNGIDVPIGTVYGMARINSITANQVTTVTNYTIAYESNSITQHQFHGQTLPITFNQTGDHDFLLIQEGTGDPSPENVRPITPGLTFTRDDDSVLSVYGGTLTVNEDGTGSLKSEWMIFGVNDIDTINRGNPDSYEGEPTQRYYFTIKNVSIQSEFVSSAPQLLISNVFTVPFGPANSCIAARMVEWVSLSGNVVYICIKQSRLIANDANEMKEFLGNLDFVAVGKLVNPTTYTLSVTETNRALEALGFTQHIGPVYGGTVTINPDGSADVVSDRTGLTLTGDEYWTKNGTNEVYNSLLLNGTNSSVYISGICSHVGKDHNVPTCINNAVLKHTYNYTGLTFCQIKTYWGLPDNEVSTWKAYLSEQFANGTPIQIVARLREPQTYHFSNLEQLKVWLGENNFWCDISDDITVKYWNRG